MGQKIFSVPGVGEVLVVKRRGAKHLRIIITATGQVKISQPVWLPYSAGLQFAASKRPWIDQHVKTRQVKVLKDGDGIGKSFRLRFKESPNSNIRTRLIDHEAVVFTNLNPDQPAAQTAAQKVFEKALKKDAEILLKQRLDQLSSQYGYRYKEIKIKKMTSRWGSCSSDGRITLSIYLIQLPWPLIDYVILHELAHTRHLNHSREFWNQLKLTAAPAMTLRKQIKSYQPVIIPTR